MNLASYHALDLHTKYALIRRIAPVAFFLICMLVSYRISLHINSCSLMYNFLHSSVVLLVVLVPIVGGQ